MQNKNLHVFSIFDVHPLYVDTYRWKGKDLNLANDNLIAQIHMDWCHAFANCWYSDRLPADEREVEWVGAALVDGVLDILDFCAANEIISLGIYDETHTLYPEIYTPRPGSRFRKCLYSMTMAQLTNILHEWLDKMYAAFHEGSGYLTSHHASMMISLVCYWCYFECLDFTALIDSEMERIKKETEEMT